MVGHDIKKKTLWSKEVPWSIGHFESSRNILDRYITSLMVSMYSNDEPRFFTFLSMCIPFSSCNRSVLSHLYLG